MSTSGINLSGLSGYDFSAILDAMVTSYKLPENQMSDKVTKLTTQKSAWQDINTRLSALDSALAKLKDSQLWKATTATTSANNSFFSVAGTGSGVQGNYTVNISKLAQSETDVSRELTDSSLETMMNTALGTSYADNGTSSNWDFTLSVNGQTKTVHVVKSDSTKTAPTLQDVVNSINHAGIGAKASLIQSSTGNYRIAFNTSQTGAANGITFGDPNGFLKTIGVLNGSGSLSDYSLTGLNDPTLGGKIQRAQDAVFTVNGLEITSASNTVANAISGVTLTLSAPGQSTVTVSPDNKTVEDAVQAFVDAYNAAQQTISKYNYYDDKTKKAGALLGDSSIQSIQAALRQKVGSVLNNPGTYKMLSEVGVSTSGKGSDLIFNKTKFEKALATDTQSVANLFSASYGGTTPADNQGLANLMEKYLDPLTKYGGILATKTSSFDEQIKDLNDRITEFEAKALTYEENLKIKFAKLEASLTALNNQSSWLTAQVSSMYSSKSK